MYKESKKDIYETLESSVEFCPTIDMIGGFFTKALQEYKLCCFRNIILFIHEDDILAYKASVRSLLEERKLKLNKDK